MANSEVVKEELLREVEKVDKRVARLEVTVATEFLKIGEAFRGVHKRFDTIDQSLDGIDRRFDKLEAAFTAGDDRLDAIDTRMTEGFRDIAARIDRLAARRGPRRKRP